MNKAVAHLKGGKSDGEEGLMSDNVINGTHALYVHLSLVFNAMLIHGLSPDSMLLATMIPIPKDKRKSLCDSNNYRAIALSSILGKTLDWVILLKEEKVLMSSNLQFGFKHATSTTQCTFTLLETVSYYNMNRSNVYVLLLDATKAFDRVQYCKLFGQLIDRKVSPIVIRLLIQMYTSQKLQVKWSNCISDMFEVKNGVKQGGVLSPVLFAIYMDGLLERLQESGVGCHVGSNFTGALAFADDLTLLSPTIYGLEKLTEICESYADEYNIKFNGSKSKLLLFKGRECKTSARGIVVKGEPVGISTNAVHLGHYISTADRDAIVKVAKSSFWRAYNLFMADYGHIYSFLKNQLFNQYCCSFYGSPLWKLDCDSVNDLCVAQRKALRRLWRVDSQTHCDIIYQLSDTLPLAVSLKCRFKKFFVKCLTSKNAVVRGIANTCLSNPMSTAGSNYKSMLNDVNEFTCKENLDEWAAKCENNKHTIGVLKETIDIRDNYITCDGFSDEINFIIDDICLS